MLKRLLVLAFAVTLGALTIVGCTDNSGNGAYNPNLKPGQGGASGGGGGGGGAGGDDAATTDDAANEDGGQDGLPVDGLPLDGALGG